MRSIKTLLPIVMLGLVAQSANALNNSGNNSADSFFATLQGGSMIHQTLTCTRSDVQNPNVYGLRVGKYRPNNMGYELSFTNNTTADIITKATNERLGTYDGNKLAGYLTYNFAPQGANYFISSKVGLANVYHNIEADRIDTTQTRKINRIGLAAGMGVGYFITPSLSLALNYNYANADEQFHDVTFGASYHF